MLKKVLALVLAGAMVIGSVLPAMAEGETTTTNPTGTITINSPILGAEYTGYRIFDMTTGQGATVDANDDTNPSDFSSFAYYIDTNSVFYPAVSAYALDKANGLILTPIPNAHVNAEGENPAYDKFIVTAVTDDNRNPDYTDYTNFDAQKFGKAMQTAINGTPAVEADEESGTEAQAAVPGLKETKATELAALTVYPNYGKNADNEDETVVTLAKAASIDFENLPLGYYLITAKYPETTATATLTIPATTAGGQDTKVDFDKADLEAYNAAKKALDEASGTDKEAAQAALDATDIAKAASDYATAMVTDDYLDDYIEKNIQPNLADPSRPLTTEERNNVKNQLLDSFKNSAIENTLNALNNVLANSESDRNVKEPLLVFVDSTTPHAYINEKNELDKWNVPITPEGSADLKDVPDHGEPEGGKNIVVGYAEVNDDGTFKEGATLQDQPGEGLKPVYADWVEANVGDEIKYELRVSAMNFVRNDPNDATDVERIKEYIIADYQNDALEYKAADGIKVKIVKDDGTLVKDLGDYGAWAEYFFIDKADVKTNADGSITILNNGGGIAIPFVASTDDLEEAKKHPGYTTSNEPKYVPYTLATGDNVGDDGLVYNNDNLVEVSYSNDNTKLSGTYNVKKDADDKKFYLVDKAGNKIPEIGNVKDKDGKDVEIPKYVLDTDMPYVLTADGNYALNANGELIYNYVNEYKAEGAETATRVSDYTKTVAADGTITITKNEVPANATRVPVWAPDPEDPSKDYIKDGLYVQAKEVKQGPKTEPHYWYSIYDSDVNIVVNYTMILRDKATIDMPGNVNTSQYGYNIVDDEDGAYTTPDPTTKPVDKPDTPDQEREPDTATVYTYALAIQKQDQNKADLAGATFKLKGLTVKKLADGYYKVLSYNPNSADWSEELTMDKTGLLIVEGLTTSDTLKLKEESAPAGYNKLTDEVDVTAKKIDKEVTTNSETVYKDANGDPTTKANAKTRETVYTDSSNNVIAKESTMTENGVTEYTYVANGATKIFRVKKNALGEEKYYTVTTVEGKEVETEVTEASAQKALMDGFEAAKTGAATEDSECTVTSSDIEATAIPIVNRSGVELPSTGGIGTTIFYAGGAILVLLAGVLLVSKRRYA